jgi:hypothetical protein
MSYRARRVSSGWLGASGPGRVDELGDVVLRLVAEDLALGRAPDQQDWDCEPRRALEIAEKVRRLGNASADHCSLAVVRPTGHQASRASATTRDGVPEAG